MWMWLVGFHDLGMHSRDPPTAPCKLSYLRYVVRLLEHAQSHPLREARSFSRPLRGLGRGQHIIGEVGSKVLDPSGDPNPMSGFRPWA